MREKSATSSPPPAKGKIYAEFFFQMSETAEAVDLEEARACMNQPAAGAETRRERVKRRCWKGLSVLKVCCIANVGLLTALIYLIAETKAGVQLADKLLASATEFILNIDDVSSANRDNSLQLVAQLLYNFTQASKKNDVL